MVSDSESETGHFSTEQFKDVVKEYIKIYDRLAETRKDTAMLNKRKKKLSETIVAFMSNNDKEICSLGNDGTLQVKTSKTTQALKKEQVEQLLIQLGNSENNAKETAAYLWENKTTKERKILKRNIRPLV
jgi:hypothetical protein